MLQEENPFYELWDIECGVRIFHTKSRGEMNSLVNLLINSHGESQKDVLVLILPTGIRITGKSLLAWAKSAHPPRTR